MPKQPTMIERIKFYLKQTNNLSEIARQISIDTGILRTRGYVFWYVKEYNIPQPLQNKALKPFKKLSTGKH